MTQILEVHTTSDFTYNGEVYNIDQDFISPKKCLSFTSNHIRSNKKVTSRLYEGMRHEILNETDRMTVWNDVLDTLDSWAD